MITAGRNSTVAVLAALLLVLVPTLFSVFPAWEINGLVVAAETDASGVIAAAPIETARGTAIGVLAVRSTKHDAFFRRPDGQLALISLAGVVARVLIDIGRLATD